MAGQHTRRPVGAIGQLLFSPIRFFRARLERPPDYVAAFVPLAAYAVLVTAAALVTGRKTRLAATAALEQAQFPSMGPPWIGDLFAVVSSVTAVGFMFAASALAAVALDLLFAQSGRSRRLVEFAALSYWSQLPFAAAWLGITVWWWRPEPLSLAPGATSVELFETLRAYQGQNAETGLLSTLQLVGAYFWCWFVALECAALRVVSGFTVAGAWAAGVSLATLFVGAPYAFEVFW